MSAGVDVVIVAFHAHDRLRRCLESLRSHPPEQGLAVVVVDNGNDAATAELVRSVLPGATTLEPHANLGFARATNLGIRHGSAGFVLVLNPDTEVYDGTLETLLRVLEEHPEVAVVGPQLVREDGTLDHAARRSFPTPLSALAHFTGIGRRARGGRLAQYRAPEIASGPVDAVNGAFMLCRRTALEEIGLFDEGYWWSMEDLDLCYRLKQAGRLTWYEEGPRALHVKHGTSGEIRAPRLEWAFHHGMLRFYRTHYAPQRNLLVNAAVYAGIGVRAAIRIGLALVVRPLLRLARRG